MKIAFLTEHFPPKVDGVSILIKDYLIQLSKRNCQCMVFTNNPDVPSDTDSVKRFGGVSLPWYKDRKIVLPTNQIYKQLMLFKPDVVHVANYTWMAFPALSYAKKTNAIAIMSYHTHYDIYAQHYRFGWLYRAIWPYVKKIMNQFDLIMCPSDSSIQALKIKKIEKLFVWRHGVDTEHYHPNKLSQKVRAKLTDNNPSAFILLYVGRLSVEKRVGLIRPLLDLDPRIRLVIVGDGPHKKELETDFAGTNTVFLGCINDPSLSEIYASSDLLILPSDSETFGCVLIEAMASGCPVMAADAGGISNVVTHGRGGFLFQSGRPNAILECFRQYYESEDRWQSCRIQARQEAFRWTWNQSVTEYLSACESLIQSRVSSSRCI